MVYLFLIFGFVLLIKGADFFVDGSSSVAKLLKVPAIIIGLTVVAFGTSMPEASVSITAALQGKNNLAVSNVLGSNMFNLLIVLGASALMRPILTSETVTKREFPFSIFITAALLALTSGFAVSDIAAGQGEYTLGRVGGVILLILFAVFLFVQVKGALKARDEHDGEVYEAMPPLKSAAFIIIGLAGIIWGGNLVVDSATEIAQRFGLSQTFIGLTIVAMGTSLPELVTSMVAAKKGENDLALGNVVGSNIFNILLILGSSAAISPIVVDVNAIYDMIILIIISVLVYICSKSQKELSKKEGIMFLLVYLVYFGYIYTR
ncbi:calcium/sodium antiporter [Bariatricus massiliensis]|uniref:Calcium/sodium antiporter n=1 Tax=Bariatricus massiliensis TaxID=1745713 RepID=A0ABS8DLZ2_9FIRM|nr:calcium/sodium antiporter [Bariatricus massiliensis]MCB7306388.1 calcium/sodium antiporter [Bariatricus massiliensis]MCB7376813.1 calcium/sodium antiporter [Bariatricus massiliensis]MCB7389468.1 calcium/sodium antiporter [Bariatricus massiliensis]MCB7413638.1 calcium/sodium antiporter [Bariatricus massiliensis]MCQ5255529.1 calcium/sodium antiporter [Bariatricus massiliensis]